MYNSYLMMLIIVSLLTSLAIKDLRAERECYYDGNDFCINQEDILSADLLPGFFLLTDPTTQGKNQLEKLNNVTIDGSIDRALSEMEFHRKRMNEYLCHGFMAEEIFREIKTTRVKRRPDDRATLINSLPDFLGDSLQYENENEIDTENEINNVTVHDKLLSDEGSAKYKDWLQRTTTLDDIYRHYAPQKKLKKKITNRHPPRKSHVTQSHGIQEFDGEVTGYAMPAHMTPDKVGPYYDEDHMLTSSSGHSYHQYGGGHDHYGHQHEVIPIIHEEHYYEHPSHHEEEEYYHKPSHYKGKGHELTIKDFFEIALTALAFLAFGLFIIQLLMNITNPMTTTTTTAATALFTDIDATRFKRNSYSSGKPVYSSVEEFNALSHRVLRSIEAALVAEQDSGRCLRWSLCTDNSESRFMKESQRIWLPVWSLGMSWLSGRMLSRKAWPAMFESVKASVLGLGGIDCNSLYPHCDLPRERIKRRRRRRK